MPKNSSKPTDEEMVAAYMDKLVHPLKEEIEALRVIIKEAHEGIGERIKWNAPSYYYKEDMVTFHPRNEKIVHLVFHHRFIVDIASDFLKGDYKNRRMMYFRDITEIRDRAEELKRILRELVNRIDKEI